MRCPLVHAQMNVPIIGVVENMSYFQCSGCGQRHEIFKRASDSAKDFYASPGSNDVIETVDGRRHQESSGAHPSDGDGIDPLPLLCRVPISPRVCSGAENGAPVCIASPDSDAAMAFTEVSRKIWAAVSQQSTDATRGSLYGQ